MSGRSPWPPPIPAPRMMYVQWAGDSYDSTHSTHRIDPTDVAYVRLDVVEGAVRAAFEDYSQWVAEYGDTFVAAVMDRLNAQHDRAGDSDQSAKSDGDGPPKQDPSDVRQRLRDAGADAWDDQPMVRASEIMDILDGLPADATWSNAVREWKRLNHSEIPNSSRVIREHDAGDEHR